MVSEAKDRPSWGLLPEDVLNSLRNKQWRNPIQLKKLLSGDSVFPIEAPLKPPRGNAALENINHFRKFVTSWKEFSRSGDAKQKHYSRNACDQACEVKWESRTFRSLSEQEIPTHLKIPDIGSLACLLGNNEERRLREWQSKIAYVFDSLLVVQDKCDEGSFRHARERDLFLALIDHLETLDKFDHSDLDLLVKLIPQLKQGMGEGCYLRALPVTFVDTKFIEKNLRIIESVTAALIDGIAGEVGLLSWLHCKEKPKDWLLIKPLCDQTIESLGGVPLLRLSSDTLLKFELPAGNILVIENEQSCLALDNIPNTIAISGGGKNVAWMKAGWLSTKRVGYWGDIDSEGFTILSDTRSKLSTIIPLMMDAETVEAHQERMVAEPESVFKEPIALTEKELVLFRELRAGSYVNTRLEQERLPTDYVVRILKSWTS